MTVTENDSQDIEKFVEFRVSPKIVEEKVELRKQKTTLVGIHERKNVCIPTITKILKSELGDSYDEYLCVKRTPITTILKKKIVKLRKQFNSIRRISKRTDLTLAKVTTILLEELGEEYNKYYVLKNISEEIARIIIVLKNKGYKIDQISLKTGISTTKLNAFFKDNSLQVFKKIFKELNRKISNEIRKEIFSLYHKLRDHVRIYYRNTVRLLPVVIYIVFKINGLPIHSKEIINSSVHTQTQFRDCLFEVVKHCPEYVTRDRLKIVRKKISSVVTHFHFDFEFFQTSNSLLKKFWSNISNTTENILAGVISVLTMIKLDIHYVNYNDICKYLNIGQSTVFYQVKNKILRPLHIEGFNGFKRSPELLLPLLKT